MTRKLAGKKNAQKGKRFNIGDFAVYPSHGIGKILDIETMKVGDQDSELLIMYFDREKLTIKVPTSQIDKINIRPLVNKEQMAEVFNILRSGVKKLKGMWSRRAQEYETKINSGDINLLAEVLRDLARDIEDGDRSYSERIIYETAVHRLAAEYSIIAEISFEQAREEIINTAKNKAAEGEELPVSDKPRSTESDEFDEGFDVEEEEEDEDEHEEDYEEDDERTEALN